MNKTDQHTNTYIRRIIWILSLNLILISLFFLFQSEPVEAASIVVNPSDETSYQTIQSALDDAQPGDILLVYPGIYIENLQITKSITIQGISKQDVIINGKGSIGIAINHDAVQIQNITITNATIGIEIIASTCRVNDTTIIENNYGLYIRDTSSNNSIYHNNFIENTVHATDETNDTTWSQNELGNYWGDYTGSDEDNNGIGDTAYMITNDAVDPYPSFHPFSAIPDADFYYEPADPTTQTMLTFTDVSTDADGTIVNWTWDFDDNSTSHQQHPTHQFTDDGTYLVSLSVMDDLGATNTEIYCITVRNVGPTVTFTAHPEKPLTIQEVDFIDESTDPDGTITAWSWRINNTILSNDSTFSYTFPDDGEYTVSLKVTDDDGKTAVLTKTITVMNTAPIAGFSYYSENGSLMRNVPIHFQDSSTDADGTITSWQWDFGDGVTSNQKQPSHTYSSDGDYKISLTVADDDGAQDYFSRSIRIGEIPETPGILAGLSVFDIIMVVVIVSMVIVVFIVSKKYA